MPTKGHGAWHPALIFCVWASVPSLAWAQAPTDSTRSSTTADVDTDATHRQIERTLVTAGTEPDPAFTFWQNSSDHSLFIKPVLMLSSSIVSYLPSSDVDDDLAIRLSTLALARFGLEGRLFPFLTFRSVFERNLGYTLARNGPVGTSVWEGTSSLQARENYIRLQAFGVDLTAGIYRDPGTVDYVSDNVLDTFGMDPFVRDPLLLSGFSQGQGVMVRYRYTFDDTLAVFGGFSFTGGNPLTTTLSFGFGGDVSSLGTLYSAPLRALSNGVPGSDIHLLTFTQSAGLDSQYLDVRVAFQYYDVDPDTTSNDDAKLSGWNTRSTFQVKIPFGFRVFGSFAIRRNEQLDIPDVTTKKENDFEGVIFGGGIDYTREPFSVGYMYNWHRSDLGSGNNLTLQYVNLGASYWIYPKHVVAGLRWARSMSRRREEPDPLLKATDNFIISLRLLI